MFRKGQGLVGCAVVLMFSLLWPSNACNSHEFITVIAESGISSLYTQTYLIWSLDHDIDTHKLFCFQGTIFY